MDVVGTRASHVRLPVMLLVVGACIVGLAGALKCLQCMDPREGGTCAHDYMGQVNTSQGIFKNNSRPYYKECPNGTYGVSLDYCVIETFYVGGTLKSMIKDCSDGSSFSFTGTVKNEKLNNVVPDNYTTCVYLISANAHICVTLCAGDFCNAPRPPPNETSVPDVICNDTDFNATCGARSLSLATPGPFGPTVDRLLSRAFLLPVLVAVFCLQIFG